MKLGRGQRGAKAGAIETSITPLAVSAIGAIVWLVIVSLLLHKASTSGTRTIPAEEAINLIFQPLRLPLAVSIALAPITALLIRRWRLDRSILKLIITCLAAAWAAHLASLFHFGSRAIETMSSLLAQADSQTRTVPPAVFAIVCWAGDLFLTFVIVSAFLVCVFLSDSADSPADESESA
jgi:uncharacterized ion transporter superfamily protein YfcC